jgi:hypothetical protein
MEHILDKKFNITAPNLASYYFHDENKGATIKNLFPRSRRLLIMLAQIGFLSNDFNPGNILVTDKAVLIIDIAKATRIPEEEMVKFQSYLDSYQRGSESASNLLRFLYGNVPYVAKTEEDKTDVKYLDCQWLGQNQIDTYVEGIDPTVVIAPERVVIEPLRLTEEQKALCLNPTKINYVEREAAREEAARIAREADAEAARRKAAEETPERAAAIAAMRKREEEMVSNWDFS